MNFTQFFVIVLARKWVALGVLALVVGATALYSLLAPKQYVASVTLVVDSKGKDPLTGQFQPSQIFPGYLATQIQIISSPNVAAKVVRALGLHKRPGIEEDFREATGGRGDIADWLGSRLLPQLEVEPSRDSNLIKIKFSGSDPAFASIVANAFAKAYLDTNLELRLDPAKQTTEWFDQQIETMRGELNNAQQRLTAYQRDSELVETEERFDVENRRLSEISAQIVNVQNDLFDLRSRERAGKSVADITNNPVVQNLRIQVAQGETRLVELRNRLGENHPDYQRVLAEVESTRGKLEAEMGTAARTVGAGANVLQRRLSDLQAAFATQKERVLGLKEQRERALVLTREVDNAQRMYDAAMQRYSMSRMEAQTNQTDIVILDRAQVPTRPAKPNIFLNLLIALFAGTLLGIAAAVVTEVLGRKVRVPHDLTDTLGIPLLASVKPQRGKFRQALSRMRPARLQRS